ncbi:hypothetical protein CR513_34482, partial [Mucuna pruriens]
WKSKKKFEEKRDVFVAFDGYESEDDLVIALGQDKTLNCLYMLKENVINGISSIAIDTTTSKGKIWHQRLGHISKHGLQELEKYDCYVEIKFKASNLMNIIRKVRIYLLKSKNEAFKTFVQWKTRIKTLRIDNGLELYGDEFNQLCKENEFYKNNIVRNTPQQNELAERIN